MLWQLFLLDAVVMTLCWLWATSNHRAGIVDVAWSFCIVLNIAITALFVEIAPLNVRLFLGVFSSIWFLRLTLHLEPYRVCRRLNILRNYSDEKTNLYPRN